MARPLRLDYPGALWHVTARGNEKRAIFADDGDRKRFLTVLGRTAETFRWQVYAWVLMENHYHLVFETQEATLSRGMRQLNGIYTQRFNSRHGRVGHLFQGRFKSVLVERQSHLLELVRYVHLNPVRAGIVKLPRDWAWSSYRALVGTEAPPGWLSRSWLLAQFDDHDETRARRLLAAFVAEGVESSYQPWQQVIGQLFLGDGEFARQESARLGAVELTHEFTETQRRAGRPGTHELVEAVVAAFEVTPEALRERRRGPARKAAAWLGRSELALHLRELGPVLGVADWSVGKLAREGERLAETSEEFRARLSHARRILREEPEFTENQT